jgi:predicted PhzF superfamily epimerase YddE/YHI9
MAFPLYIVDAFSSSPFGGNPAGVCILPAAQDPEWMQSVAAELNVSETAFVYPANGAFHLRWFAPAAEVALCGHATVATSHILWSTGILKEGQDAEYDTLSGRLTATKEGSWVNLNFPSLVAEEMPAPDGLLEAVGVSALFVGRSRFDVLIEVESEDQVRGAKPDFAQLIKAPVRGTILTARSNSSEFDFVSRFFCPTVGVNEDPATGSSHCTLSPYWSAKLGRTNLTGRQLSRRGGVVKTTLLGSRVQLSGQAVTVMAGQLL